MAETIKELKEFFATTTIPKEIRISQCEVVVDTQRFIQSHIRTLESNPGNRLFLPFYLRLRNLKQFLCNPSTTK